MDSQEIIGAVSFLIGVYATYVYISSIFKGETKPHLFTWLIWGILSSISYAAQIFDHAGPGSWAMGWTAFSCLLIAAIALKYGEKNITRSDWIAFIASMSCIVPWLLTKDPLGSVILISIIDLVAFYPTFRKSWHKPHEEHLIAYHIANTKLILSLFAMANFTAVNVMYPLAIVIANSLFIVMCYWKRRSINKKAEQL